MLKSKSNTYDATGRLISETTSSGGSVNYGYNALNLRTQLTNARGQARTYTYDAIGRVTGYTSVEGSASYTYDKNGNVLTATDQNGTVTREYDALNRVTKYIDTLGNVIRYEYDTYGNLISRTGTSVVIFLYNGRDGVVTDSNGLIYMRARYYRPELRRFINADIIAGEISNAVTLNRYAYANGNPVSNIDPFGLSAERGQRISYFAFDWSKFDGYYAGSTTAELILDDINRVAIYNTLINSIKTAVRPNNIGKGTWNKIVAEDLRWVEKTFGKSSNLAKALKSVPYITVALDTGLGVYENIQNNSELQQTISDAIVDIGFGLGGIAASTAAGSAAGSIVPDAGTAVGAVVGFVAGTSYYVTTDVITIKGKTLVDWAKYGAGWLADKIAGK